MVLMLELCPCQHPVRGQAPGGHTANAMSRQKLPSGGAGIPGQSQSQGTENGEGTTGFSMFPQNL